MYALYYRQPSAPAAIINGGCCSIGSASTNQLVLDDTLVSPFHVELYIRNGELTLQTIDHSQRVLVNEQPVQQQVLKIGDSLLIGDTQLEVRAAGDITELWRIQSVGGWMPQQCFALHEAVNLLGRGRDCDISFPRTHLARAHAELIPIDHGVVIKDLGSSSGSFINSQRITEGIALDGDELRFDIYRFTLLAPSVSDPSNPAQSIPADLAAAAESKTLSRKEKRWITSPTSPGNRIEPSKPREAHWLLAMASVLLVVVIGFLIYLLTP